jgi:hypothetical protein
VCLSVLLSTQGAAQTQPQPQRPPGALPQRTARRPTAPAPAAAPYCMFESKEYSIGAVLCVSSHMSQVCTAPDTEHNHSWWSSGPQPLCSSPRSLPSRRLLLMHRRALRLLFPLRPLQRVPHLHFPPRLPQRALHRLSRLSLVQRPLRALFRPSLLQKALRPRLRPKTLQTKSLEH